MTIVEIVKRYHGSQVRKYTGEPYFNHLQEVVDILKEHGHSDKVTVISAYCHDLLEDTVCTRNDLYNELFHIEIPLSESKIIQICDIVEELTDVYTKEGFPELNRMRRKKLECSRLSTVSDIAQTIKYADIISNTKSIFEHDPKFGIVYEREKNEMLSVVDKGDVILWQKAVSQLQRTNQQPPLKA